jgi:ATP-binding cassette, subfamily G (WHITE), member 2, PDR
MVVLMIFGCAVHLLATEYISSKKSRGEVLVFPRGKISALRSKVDEEANSDEIPEPGPLIRQKRMDYTPGLIQKQTAIFHWDSISYDIKIKGKSRRILDEIDGWIIPGTLTALMVKFLSRWDCGMTWLTDSCRE